MTARLLDSCGRVVWEALVEEGTQAMALEGQWPDGLYVLQLYNGQETWTENVVVR